MKYYSTRDHAARYTLKQAAFMGLAPDGGLFMPERIPTVDKDRVLELSEGSFAGLAEYIAGLFFGEDLSLQQIRRIVEGAYRFPVPLRYIGDDKYTLELFHGPTFAFKDVGAGFMGRALGELNEKDDDLVILTATSGDTGSAVANGFYGIEGIRVVVLYPEGKVSDLQESQMTTLGGNIHPLKVRGTFDDCQRIVKEIFSDAAFRREKAVTSANSINLLRWMPQSFYYFYAWAQWKKTTGEDAPDIVVPSGNYGNLSAGMLAARMGMPVGRFVAASNANDIIPKYLETGVFEPRASVMTLANAMDVGNPSNYERILDLYGGDFTALTAGVKGYRCDDEAILAAIRELYERYGYVSDPHSAVGYNAAKAYQVRGFWLSTAHWAKFSNVIHEALGRDFDLPEGLRKFLGKEKHFTPIDPDTEVVEEFVRGV